MQLRLVGIALSGAIGFAFAAPALPPTSPTVPPAAPTPVPVENPNNSAQQQSQPATGFDVRALAAKARPAVALVVVMDKAGKPIKSGTGFFVSAGGKLITNAHVIEGAAAASAKLENGATYAIQGVLKADVDKDLVLLQADAKGVPFLPIGKQGLPDVGSRVAVIGSPLGLEGSVSEGIVSGQRTLKKDDEWLQITAAVSPGSSGSPVLDDQGSVIGVATFLLDKAQSLNFARPLSYVSQLIDQAANVSEPAGLWTIAVDPKNVLLNDPQFIEAQTALRKDDPAKALKILNGVAPKYPENASLLFNLGVIYDRLNLLDDAVQAYQHAVKIDPTNGAAWANLGVTFLRLQRFNDAKEAARQSVKVAPDLGPAWALLGTVYQHDNRTADSVDAFKKATQLAPKDTETWKALQEAYGKLNDPAGAQVAQANVAALTASSPSPLPTAPQVATPVTNSTYAKMVDATLHGFERDDIDALVAKYDDKVAYRDYGIVDREFIRRDLQKYFERWPMTKVRLVAPVEVLPGKRPNEKTVRYRYEFRAASPDRKSFSVGDAWTVWSVAEKPNGVKIWGEAQKVFMRPSH